MAFENRTAAAAGAFCRCEHCRAVLPVSFVDLAQAGGMVRCGHCGRTINALARIYTRFPGDSSVPVRARGLPPMLQPAVEQEQIPIEGDRSGLEGSGQPSEAAGHSAHGREREPNGLRGPVLHLDPGPDTAPAWSRWLWPALAAVLLALVGLQLFGPERWRVPLNLPGLGDSAPAYQVDAVHVVSRDLHRHPSLADAFVISVVLVNQARERVAWPNIDLKLFDESQQLIGQRRLAPNDYLDPETDIAAGFRPGVQVPVVLEMTVESSRPAGFSMSFYYSAPEPGSR